MMVFDVPGYHLIRAYGCKADLAGDLKGSKFQENIINIYEKM